MPATYFSFEGYSAELTAELIDTYGPNGFVIHGGNLWIVA